MGTRRFGDRERLLAEVLAGAMLPQASASAGMSLRTAERFMAEGGGRERLEAMRVEIRARLVNQAVAVGVEALTFLRRVVADEDAALATRVQAARVVLSSGLGMQRLGLEERSVQVVERDTHSAAEWAAKRRQHPALVAKYLEIDEMEASLGLLNDEDD